MVTLVNRAKVSTSTTGTGTITLGPALDGYQTFADAGVTDGQTVRYVIEDGSNWEIGSGTYTATGTTLTRSVSESSNAGAAINLSGTATVFLTAAAEDIVQPGDNVSDLTNDAGYTTSTGTVTSVAAAAGTGISVTGSPITTSGTLTITNTAPDQTVSLTNGTGISTSGTYPDFTITNTAPDQTVVLTEGSNVTITGTYPNFTIASADQFTGTVTSVGGTGTVNGLSLSGTVTSSGNLTLGGTFSATVSEISDLTATAAELNLLDGATVTTAEINYLDIAALGTSQASKAVTTDANGVTIFDGGVVEDDTTITSSAGAATINCRDGNVFSHTLSENVTYTFSNAPASGRAFGFTLKVTQDSTARTITWPASVDWPAATAPTLSTGNGEVDVFVFFTTDGGTTWYGFTAGQVLS